MAFRIPRTKDLDMYSAEMKKINKLRKKQRASLQVLGLKGHKSTMKKMRPFSAPRQRSMERTHYSNNRTLNAIKGTNTIPNLATYTTPSLRTNIGPIYPSRYGIHDELNHKLNQSIKKEMESIIMEQQQKLQESQPIFSPKQRIDERERQILAGMKNTTLKYRSNGIDVAIALSEAATLCLQRPPGAVGDDHKARINQQNEPNQKIWPNTRRVALCVATIEKLCQHPRLNRNEQEQLEIIVDTIKNGLYSNRYFGPSPKEELMEEGNVAAGEKKTSNNNNNKPFVMEPRFYFDMAKQLEDTNDHLLNTNETLQEKIRKEHEQVNIYKKMLKESQEKVASLRVELEEHDKRNTLMNKRVVYMQDAASDSLEEYNKLNSMYVDLDARYTVTHNKANKLDKELTGLHKMYNGVSGELSQALKVCGQLETKLKLLEPLEGRLRTSQIEAATLTSELDDYKMKVSMLEQQISSQNDQLKSLKRRSSMIRRGSSMGSMVNLLKKK